MAGILKVDELRGIASAGDITVTSEGGAATQSLQQGLAKSWSRFNGNGTVAIQDSLNMSSVTDQGTGQYETATSNAFGNTYWTYSLASRKVNDSLDIALSNFPFLSDTKTTTNLYFRVVWRSTAVGYDDGPEITTVYHGDLA